MAEAQSGLDPLTAIISNGQRVYSERADALIREVVAAGGREWIEEMLVFEYNPADNPDVQKLEGVLLQLRQRLLRPARVPARGLLALSSLGVAVALCVLAASVYVMIRASWDEAAGYAGIVIRKGVTYTPSRHGAFLFVVLRHADGSTEKRYLRTADSRAISVGDSVVKWAGSDVHVHVVRKSGLETSGG